MDQNPFFPKPIANACLLIQVLDEKPRVTDYYPPSFQNEAILNHAPLFCFPEKTIQSSSYQFKGDVASQCWRYHNFVFTGVSGERYYGHCLRFSTHHLSSASTTNTSNTSSATTNNANPNVRSPRDRTTSPIESKSDIEMFLDSCYFDASLEESFTNTTPEDVDNTMVFTISNQPKIGRGVAIGVRGAPPITEPKRPTNASQEQLSKSQSDYTLDAAVCILSSTPFFNTIRTWLVHTWKEALVRPQHKPFEPRLVALLHELCAFGSNTTTLKLALRVHNSIKPYIQSESVTAKTIQTSSETQSTKFLEFVQAPVPYLIGISHQVIPIADFNAMLNEQRRFDLQVADLIVNLDTDTVTEFNEENKPNDEKENEFYEVDLTSNTSSAPTLNPNVSNSSSNSQFRIGRHKSSKNIKWKGVKSNITSLPKDVATRLKQRLRRAIESEIFHSDVAYIPKINISQNERNLKRRLQIAFFMTYLDLLTNCDLQDKEKFLIGCGYRRFYEQWFASMVFARFEEEKDIDFTPAKFLVSLLNKPPASVKATLTQAFRVSEDAILFTELPSVIPSVDPQRQTKAKPGVKVFFRNELFPPFRYDRYIQQINQHIQKNANKADNYILRLYYYVQTENYEKFFEDLTTLMNIEPKHPLFSFNKFLSTLFTKMPKEILERTRTKYPQLQRFLEENESQEKQREKASSEDWTSVDIRAAFRGDLSFLEKLPLPEPETSSSGHDVDTQQMSKSDFTRYLMNNKICDNFAVALRLFEIVGGNVKRNTIPLRTVRQLISCLKEQQQLTRTTWEKLSKNIPSLNEPADSSNIEPKQTLEEIVILHATSVTYWNEQSSTRGSLSDSGKDNVEMKGTFFLTDQRIIFIPSSTKPETQKTIVEIKLRSISRIEKYNLVRKPLTPPLECVRIIRNLQYSRGTTPPLEIFFFSRGERSIWLKSITEIAHSQKVSYDLDDPSFHRRASVAVILAHVLKKLTISMSKLESLFIFQDFYQSNAYRICKELVAQGTLNTLYKWDETGRQRRDPCQISADILTSAITFLYSYYDPVSLQQRLSLASSAPESNSIVLGSRRSPPNDKRELNLVSLRETKEFEEFVRATAEYQVINISKLSEVERMLFLINLYNTMVIHGLFFAGFPQSTLEWRYFARFTCYNIGGFPITLDGVLRLLRGTGADVCKEGADKVFKNNDPRLQWALTRLDPRVHFSLCLFNIYSPPVYIITSPSKLEHRLHFATETYCQSSVSFDPTTHEIMLPKIFSWYASDFGDNIQNVLKWIANYLPADRAVQLRKLIESGNYSISYKHSWEPMLKPKQQ